jgi:GrpB-like predicted nucleotidyltransferase (UPF0157 family)
VAIAKPVIDMLAVVADVAALDARSLLIAELGYESLGEFGIVGRRYFRKSKNGVRTHQIHAFAKGSPEIRRHVAFRDYLRAHHAEAQRYAQLKEDLAARFSNSRDRYTEGKTNFIRAIEQGALSTVVHAEQKP